MAQICKEKSEPAYAHGGVQNPCYRSIVSNTDTFEKYLQGRQIISVPLAEKEVMHIGYVLCKEQSLSELGVIYVEALKKYAT